jgi:hypothetical protein
MRNFLDDASETRRMNASKVINNADHRAKLFLSKGKFTSPHFRLD